MILQSQELETRVSLLRNAPPVYEIEMFKKAFTYHHVVMSSEDLLRLERLVVPDSEGVIFAS